MTQMIGNYIVKICCSLKNVKNRAVKGVGSPMTVLLMNLSSPITVEHGLMKAR